MEVLNPRVQRDELKGYIGKKVTIGTRSYHYVSGICESVSEDNQLVVRVAGRPVLVPLAEVATIQEASAAQAEYVK